MLGWLQHTAPGKGASEAAAVFMMDETMMHYQGGARALALFSRMAVRDGINIIDINTL